MQSSPTAGRNIGRQTGDLTAWPASVWMSGIDFRYGGSTVVSATIFTVNGTVTVSAGVPSLTVTETVSVLPAALAGALSSSTASWVSLKKRTEVMVTGLLGWLSPVTLFAVV